MTVHGLVQRGVPRGRLIALAHTVTGLSGWWLFQDSVPDGLRYALCLLLSFSGGVTRNEALKLCGNGVVTPQAVHALRVMLDRIGAA